MSRPGYIQLRETDENLGHIAAICERLGLEGGHGAKTKALNFALRIAALGLVQQEDTMSEKVNIVQIDTKPEPDPYTGGSTYAEFWLNPDKRECGISQERRTGSTDSDVYHRRILVASIANPDGEAAKSYLESNAQELLTDIIAGHSIDWDGHNMRGGLTEEVRQTWLTLVDDLEHLPESDWQMWDLDDYLNQSDLLDDIGAKTDEELDALAAKIEAEANADNVTFTESVTTYLYSERIAG